jgi:glycosyltransferase involved in cell wall biosynthesis
VTPNVLIEAMAMRIPVVSTRSRGIPELVEDGVTGILVEPRDAEALAQAIVRLVGDRALCDRLVARARESVERRFDVSKNIAEYARLFRALGNGHQPLGGAPLECAEGRPA